MKSVLTVIALTALAQPAFAQFEGVLEMKMAGGPAEHRTSGTIVVSMSKLGARSEIKMDMGGGGAMNMTSLVLFKDADIVYTINDAAKSYSVIDRSKLKTTKSDDTWVVKKIGKDTVNGHKCEHVQVVNSSKDGQEMELWTSKDIAGYEKMAALMDRGGGHNDSMMAALKKNGADGFFVKMISKDPRSPFSMELVRADKKSVPASLFELPEGYTKQDQGAAMQQMALPADAQQKMKESMDKMTPEQREMVQKMMQQRGINTGGQPPAQPQGN